jgi:hypothetical protein
MKRKRSHLLGAALITLLASSCYESTGGERDIREDDETVLPDLNDPDIPYDPQADPPLDPSYDVPEEEPMPVSAEQFCATLAASFCEYFNVCCTDDEKSELLSMMELDCRNPSSSEIYSSCIGDYADSIRAGRIVVDTAGLSYVRSELGALSSSCPDMGSSPIMKEYYYRLVTGTALLGQLAEGERCNADEECLEGLYCSFFSGVCTATVRYGGVCRDDVECDLGYVCARGRCNEPGGSGDLCERFEECAAGYWCDGRTCLDMLAAGSSCEMDMLNCSGFCTFSYPYVCRDFCNGL